MLTSLINTTTYFFTTLIIILQLTKLNNNQPRAKPLNPLILRYRYSSPAAFGTTPQMTFAVCPNFAFIPLDSSATHNGLLLQIMDIL